MDKIKRALPSVALVLAAILVFLYAFEYYDFTFIDRPEKDNSTETEEITTGPDETEAPSDEPADTEPAETDPPIKTEPEPQIDPSQFITVSDAGVEGYYLTTMPYTSDMIIAELRLRLETTDDFSLRNRYWNKTQYTYETEHSEAEVSWVPTEEAIPALEAYMGYIFADGGDKMYIYDSYGRHLNYFNPNAYEFAYKRDADGRPLLRQAYTKTVSDEEGNKSVDLKLFDYFYLGADAGIHQATYNDATENRGVMADYPAYFGTTTSTLKRECVYNRVVQTTVKGKLESFIRTRWQILKNGEPINDDPYYAAFPFSGGYACVTDADGLMYFVNEYGGTPYPTKKEYLATGNRYVVDQLLLPLDETTALGCYYYEYGLVKARRQIYDLYQLEDWDVTYVMSDKYVMLYEDGTEFPVPANYNVLNYSNGVIQLEKNGKYGYMDYTGAWLNTPDYEDAKPFMEGLAACKRNGRWGMIDTTGKTVIPFMYDYIQSVSSGVIVCHSENGWNTYMKMTK